MTASGIHRLAMVFKKWPVNMSEFDEEEITQTVPNETMHDIVYGVGHMPIGPDRPTINMRPLRRPKISLSDGVPDRLMDDEHADTLPAVVVAGAA